MKYRAEIDGLRALAVLPVIFFHAGFEQFSGGFVGVDVFFVISGYLITSIILSEITEKKFTISNFYERRARRILPPLFFVMAVCIPFAWLWLTPSDLKDFGQSLVAVSFFSSNILFWSETGYFDTASELKPLLHTWSLAVEEQYYIIFPIFLLLAWQLGLRWIILILCIMFLTSFGLSEWTTNNNPSTSFYMLHTRGWELLIGVFVAIYLKNNDMPNLNWLNHILSLFGLCMIISAIILYDNTTPFPGFYALAPTLGTALLILYTAPNTIVFKFLSLKPIVGIGLISYSAYLWHQPLFAFANHRSLDEVSEIIIIFLCILSLILAWVSWRFVEKPFRDRSVTSTKTIFIFAVSCILIFTIIGLTFHLKQGFNERVTFSQELQDSFKRPNPENCFSVPFNHSAEEWGCYLGENKRDKIDYILFGDSHSLSLKKLVNDLAVEHGFVVFYTGSSGCVPFLGVYPKRTDQNQNNCYQLNERVYNLSKTENIKGIILSARWSYYTLGDYKFNGAQLISQSENGPFSITESIKTFSKSFNETVNSYNKIRVPIHLITQPPHQQYQPEQIYFKKAKGMAKIETASILRDKFNMLNAIPINTFNDRASDIKIYEITNLFCNQEICPVGTDSQSYYYDDDHLSIFGANRLSNIVEQIFIKSE